VISIIVPHLGQARICPTSEGLATFNLDAHDLQMMENGDNELSLSLTTFKQLITVHGERGLAQFFGNLTENPPLKVTPKVCA
jgi:hypothetical protein